MLIDWGDGNAGIGVIDWTAPGTSSAHEQIRGCVHIKAVEQTRMELAAIEQTSVELKVENC